MNIVHLNTYQNNGGAGRACLRLNNALCKAGIHSELWVNYSFEKKALTQNFSSGFIPRALTAAGILTEQIVGKIFQKPVPVPFSFPVVGKDISGHMALTNADIIHLHWVNHAFLRPADIARLAKLNKPVVWTFHDSNAFTGGCHVRYTCNHYQNECGNCPVLKNAGPNDWSHKIWLSKQKAYQDLGFSIVAPSNWMAQSVKQSKLLAMRDVTVIPNTLDTNVFKSYFKPEARKALNLPPDKFILMSGFMPSRKDLHKGTRYLLEAINLLITKKNIPKEKMELVIFGNRDESNVPDFTVKATFLRTIKNDEQLAKCYSAANVFLAPSLEDNLPNTVMESLACGTPVVGFNTGGIPDMVKHLENGYVAAYCSSADLANGVKWIYDHPEKELLSQKARETILEFFSEDVIARQHIKLYERLINR